MSWILHLDIKIRQQELVFSMLKDQLKFLEDKYPKEFVEAWMFAYKKNKKKMDALKKQLDKLEKMIN